MPPSTAAKRPRTRLPRYLVRIGILSTVILALWIRSGFYSDTVFIRLGPESLGPKVLSLVSGRSNIGFSFGPLEDPIEKVFVSNRFGSFKLRLFSPGEFYQKNNYLRVLIPYPWFLFLLIGIAIVIHLRRRATRRSQAWSPRTA